MCDLEATAEVLNLYQAVAHLKEPQIFVAHFHKIFDEMITMSLG